MGTLKMVGTDKETICTTFKPFLQMRVSIRRCLRPATPTVMGMIVRGLRIYWRGSLDGLGSQRLARVF